MPKKEKQLHLVEGRESGHWRPHTWSTQHRLAWCRHVLRHAVRDLSGKDLTRDQQHAIAAARGELLGAVSAAMLKAAGVKTIGETWQ